MILLSIFFPLKYGKHFNFEYTGIPRRHCSQPRRAVITGEDREDVSKTHCLVTAESLGRAARINEYVLCMYEYMYVCVRMYVCMYMRVCTCKYYKGARVIESRYWSEKNLW